MPPTQRRLRNHPGAVIADKVDSTPSMEDSAMSIVVRFTGAPTVTKEKYDECVSRLESEGDFPPDGLEYHVAFGSEGAFRVSEVWDSQEKFEAFGQRLMPILAELGIELAGDPEVFEVHNIIKR